MTTWVKYTLFQVPGWILAAVVLLALRIWVDLPVKVAIILFSLWVVKDLLFYPLFRVAYQTGPRTVVEQLIGLKGVAREPLEPEGYVYVRGELWHAETESTATRIAAGSPVRILRAHGMTLIVAPEERRRPVVRGTQGTESG